MNSILFTYMYVCLLYLEIYNVLLFQCASITVFPYVPVPQSQTSYLSAINLGFPLSELALCIVNFITLDAHATVLILWDPHVTQSSANALRSLISLELLSLPDHSSSNKLQNHCLPTLNETRILIERTIIIMSLFNMQISIGCGL